MWYEIEIIEFGVPKKILWNSETYGTIKPNPNGTQTCILEAASNKVMVINMSFDSLKAFLNAGVWGKYSPNSYNIPKIDRNNESPSQELVDLTNIPKISTNEVNLKRGPGRPPKNTITTEALSQNDDDSV